MERYLVLVNSNPLFDIDDKYNSRLKIMDKEEALSVLKEKKEKHQGIKIELVPETEYLKRLKYSGEALFERPEVNVEELLSPEQLKTYKYQNEYYDNNINGFSLPIIVKNDNDYFEKLSMVFEEYNTYLCNKIAFNNEPDLISAVQRNNERILNSIESYYKGDILKAKLLILEILKQYEKEDNENFFVSELDKSYAFRGIAPFANLQSVSYEEKYKEMNEISLDFFRARVGMVESIEGMLHIPFDKRGLIGTQRFSIPGIPCIYLGTTSYTCWLELNKPANESFNVSSYKFHDNGKKFKILNLVISEALINGMFNRGCDCEDGVEKKIQTKMLKLFPLILATSFTILEQERNFKSEYIVSQLIMHCLKELGIDGVAYLSKKGKDDFQYPHGVNLAIPVFEGNQNEKYGKVCGCFSLSDPVNLGAFLGLKSISSSKRSYINKIYRDKKYTCTVDFSGERKFYDELPFSSFDNFIVSKEYKEYILKSNK